MSSTRRFTIITESGRTDVRDNGDYFEMLSRIYTEHTMASGDWDRPNMLLINGKVVIPSGLADIAWEYGEDHQSSQRKIIRELHARHLPAFLKDEKP